MRDWIQSYIEKTGNVPDWWREFQSICHPDAKPLNKVQVKELACWQAAAFRLPSTQLEKSGCGLLLPAWVC